MNLSAVAGTVTLRCWRVKSGFREYFIRQIPMRKIGCKDVKEVLQVFLEISSNTFHSSFFSNKPIVLSNRVLIFVQQCSVAVVSLHVLLKINFPLLQNI